MNIRLRKPREDGDRNFRDTQWHPVLPHRGGPRTALGGFSQTRRRRKNGKTKLHQTLSSILGCPDSAAPCKEVVSVLL